MADAGAGPGLCGGERGAVFGQLAGLAGAVDGDADGFRPEDGVAAGEGDGLLCGRIAAVAGGEDGAGDGAPLGAVAAGEGFLGFADVVLEGAEIARGAVGAVLQGGAGGEGEGGEEEGEGFEHGFGRGSVDKYPLS